MPSPSLTLRKPSAPSPDAIAAFVGADEGEVASPPKPRTVQNDEVEATSPKPRTVTASRALRTVPKTEQVAAAPSFQRASRAIVERRNRSARRRTTVYLDVDVATKLAAVLQNSQQELSDAVNAAVVAWLKTK